MESSSSSVESNTSGLANFPKLFKNIRFYVLCLSFTYALSAYFYIKTTIPDSDLQIIRITQTFALSALFMLWLALMIGPVVYSFKFLPFRGDIYRARRAIGVSAFFFGLTHASFAFFGQLGGFAGLKFLDNKYLIAITLSFTALIILSLMAATSFDYMVRKLGPKWKLLHRFVYLAITLIIIHALLLGTHFQDLSGIIPQIFIGLFSILLLIEANRFDAFLTGKIPTIPRFGVTLTIAILAIGAYSIYSLIPTGTNLSLGIHAQHIQLAQQAQNQNNQNLPNLPGLSGDRNRRFTVSFLHPDNVQPNQDTQLRFVINDASSGNPIDVFQIVYAYPMHLMVVDSQLNYFEHIHPTQQSNEFNITAQFPKPGFYHLYIQFQPLGAIEQQMAFTLPVAVNATDKPAPATQPVDTNLTKTFDPYEVTLDTHGKLSAPEMTLGRNKLSFTIKDAKTKNPITTLKPFMAAFGHLTMINEQTYDFIHVHPNTLTPPPADANGGPTVDFLPIGIYGPFKPGIYRAFGEFSTKVGTDFDTDFTVEVK